MKYNSILVNSNGCKKIRKQSREVAENAFVDSVEHPMTKKLVRLGNYLTRPFTKASYLKKCKDINEKGACGYGAVKKNEVHMTNICMSAVDYVSKLENENNNI